MLELKQLSKHFRKSRVLDAIDLTVAHGERIALIGSNGAGKTTLIRCLLGEYVHEGRVLIQGIDPRADRARVLREIGFVPQLPPPLRMSVHELLRFTSELTDTPVAAMTAIAARLGLDLVRVEHLPFTKLSGGQKQKVLIALALGRPCALLILDEPAANLDPEARHAFFDLLAEQVAVRPLTLLISSHRLDEVAPLVNRVVEMDMGRIVLDDRVADSVALDGKLAVRIVLSRAEDAIARALGQWGLTADATNLAWEGVIASPDRLRFMGMLSRYVGLVRSVSIKELE
jgi:ABC-2 type transport system ATP-binding protein